MPNVLILGASGYLGLPLAKSLNRSGNYTVYGLARTPAKGQILAQNEIIPIIGDVTDASTYTKLIESTPIDIVVDTTSAYEHATIVLTTLVALSKARIATLAGEGITATPKLGFVYISGSWVQGSPSGPVNDLHPIGSSLSKGTPATAVGWRGPHEQAVLAARDVLDVAIIRPGEIYGGSSYLWSSYWGPVAAAAKSGSTEPISLPVGADARPAVLHVEDAASGIHAAVDRVHGLLGSWPVFDLQSQTISVKTMMDAVKLILGAKGEIVYAGTQGNPFYEAMALVTNNSSSRAKTALGWQPKKTAFLMRLPIYLKAWAAAQEQK